MEQYAPSHWLVDSVLLDIRGRNVPVALETIFEYIHPNSTVADPYCAVEYCTTKTYMVDASKFVVALATSEVLAPRCSSPQPVLLLAAV